MSQANVEKLRALYGHWSEGGFGAGLEIFDPLVVFVLGENFPDEGAYLGLEALNEYMRGFLEPWARLTIDLDELIPAGDTVVCAVRQRAAGAGSGVATELTFFQVWTFRGGKAVRLEHFREREDALAAAGLRV